MSLFFAYNLAIAQSNKDIAKVYIKRAHEAMENGINYELALQNFKKAMNYLDTISNKNTASLGASIYFEAHNKRENLDEQLRLLELSKSYAKQYFVLEKNKNSDDYDSKLEDFVLINETLIELKEQVEIIRKENIRKEKELRRIDSLKSIWTQKSNNLSIKVDSIFNFNKNNLAVFSKGGNFGIINDVGKIQIEANEYKDALAFDGYILLVNNTENPTKIYAYNTANKTGFLIPNISEFNSLSTHYGKVMLPRANGRLVTYPNNSYQPFVYDLNEKKMVTIANDKELFKKLKKADIIDKYNKDGEIKIDKNWYVFGGHLGGGVHPLYIDKDYSVHSFLCSIDGKILMAASDYKYIGPFYNGKLQAIYNGKTSWINQNGTKVNDAKNEAGSYNGSSKVFKMKNGNYQLQKDGVIILGNEKLEKLSDFLRKNNKD